MLLAHLVTARWLFASETPPQKQRARAAPPSNRNTPAATAARKRTAAAAKEEAADGRGDARRRGQCRGNGVLARAGSCWLVRRAKAAPDTAHVVRSMVTALRLTSEAPPQTQRGTRRATPTATAAKEAHSGGGKEEAARTKRRIASDAVPQTVLRCALRERSVAGSANGACGTAAKRRAQHRRLAHAACSYEALALSI